MIDHAPHIRAQQQAQQENTVMAELEQRSAPLLYAIIAAIIILSLSALIEQADTFLDHYIDLAAENEAMVQCLNGRLISIGNTLVGCQMHQINLVGEVQP